MNIMPRRAFVKSVFAGTAAWSLAGCGGAQADSAQADATARELTLSVFAAASLTESLTAAGELYGARHATDLVYTYDSSGTLKKQIEEGATCDVFISAGQLQMNQLDAEAEADQGEGSDYIDHATRFDMLENKVVLVVPKGNPRGITGFDDLATHLRAGDILMAMGNADVPVGQYTQKIFAYYGLDEDALAKVGVLSYGTNVKEVTSQVVEAAVDCGVVYQTDAWSAGLAVVDDATEGMCGRVVYPAAVVKGSTHAQAAQDYLAFLRGVEASACFEEVGFTSLAEE